MQRETWNVLQLGASFFLIFFAFSSSSFIEETVISTLAPEVGRHGITVNNISLGTMKTPISEALWNDATQTERHKAVLSSYVVRRPGEPDDPAWLVATLASPRASWITGQTYPVNGGYTFAL